MPSFRPSSSMPPVPSSLSPGVSDFLTSIQSSGSESSSAPLGNLFEATYLPTPPLPLPDSVLYPPPAYPPPAYPPPGGFPFGPQVPPTGRFPPPPNSPFAQPFFEGANSHYPCEPHTGFDRWHPSRNGRSTIYGSEKPSSSRFWLGPQADNSNHSSSGNENGSLLTPPWPGTQGDNNTNHNGSEFRFAKTETNFPSVAQYPPPYTLLGSNFPPLRDLSAIANAPIMPSSASPSITAPLAAPSHFSSFSSPNLPLDFPLSGPRFSFGSHGSAFVPGLDPAPAFCAGGAEYIPEPVPNYLSRTFQAPDHFHDASSRPIFSPDTATNRPLTGGSQFSFLDSQDTTSFPGQFPFFSIPPAFPSRNNNAPSALGSAVPEQPSGPAPLIESTCEFLAPLFRSGSSAAAGNQDYLRNAGCPSTSPGDEEKMERIVKDDGGEHWFQHLSPEERRWKSYEPSYDAASFGHIRSSEYNLFHGLRNSGRRDGLWFDGGEFPLDLLANPSGRGIVEKERGKAERHACPYLNGAASAMETPPLVSTGATSVLKMPDLVPNGATSTSNQSLLTHLASTSGAACTSEALGASGDGQGGKDRLVVDSLSSFEPVVVYKQDNDSALKQKVAESVGDHPSTSCSNSYKHDGVCQLEDAFCDLEGAPGPWALPTLTFEEAASVVGSSPSKDAVSAGLSVSIPHHEVSSSRLESQLPVDSSCHKSSAHDFSQAHKAPQVILSAQSTGLPSRTVTHGERSRPDPSSQGDARFDGSGLHSLAASISNLSKVMLLLDTSSLGLPDTSILEGNLQDSILRLTECLLLEQSRINRTLDTTSLAGLAVASMKHKVADIAPARDCGGSTNLDYSKASEIGRSTTSTSAGLDTGVNVHYPCSSNVAGVSKNPAVDTEKAKSNSQRMLKEFYPPQFPDAALEDVLSCLSQNGLTNRASLEKLIGAEERESELKVIVQELREELKFEREEDRGARALSEILKQEAEISKAKEMLIAVKAEVGLKTASMRFALDSSESSEEGSTLSPSLSKLELSSEMGPSRDTCCPVQHTSGRLGSPDDKPDQKSLEGGQCSDSGAILDTLARGWDEHASKTQDTCSRNDQVLSRLAILQARNQDTVNEMEMDLKSSFENLEKDQLQLQLGSGEAQPSVPSLEARNQAAIDDMQTRLKYLFPNWDENQLESQLGFVQAKPAASTLEDSSQVLIDGTQVLQKTSYANWDEKQAESHLQFVQAHPAVDVPHDEYRDTEQWESQAINLNLQLASGHQDTSSAVDQVEQRLGLLQARSGQQDIEAVTSEFLENELYPPPQHTQVDIDSSKSCSQAVEALADLIRCRPDWIEDSSQIQMDLRDAQSRSISSQISTSSGTSNSESEVEGAQNQLDTDDESSWEHVRLPK